MPTDSFLSKLKTAKTKKRRFTIYLSNEIAKKLKVYAAENDEKISDVVEDALKSKLQSVKDVKR